MKRIFFILLLFISSNCVAQKFRYLSVYNGFGIKAGTNLSRVNNYINYNMINSTYYDGFENDAKFKLGAVFGLYLQTRISNRTALCIETISSSLRSDNKYIDKDGLVKAKTKLTLNYISLPVLFKTYVGSRLNFQYGPQVSILVTAGEKGIQYWSATSHTGITSYPVQENVIWKFKRTDLSLLAGIGYDLPVGLNLSLRFVKGVSNIAFPSFGIFFGDEKKLYNLAFQFSAGYNLSSKRESK